jgi:hypothetical protein
MLAGFIPYTAGRLSLSALKKRMFDEYGGFADKRIKNLDKGQTFLVDDRQPSDFGADRGLYSYFCSIFAEVLTDDRVQIFLAGNVPVSKNVDEWAAKYQAQQSDGISRLSFIVERGNEFIINELAERIAAIVAAGKRYGTPNYKYVCPRTANSLLRLSGVLSAYWGM